MKRTPLKRKTRLRSQSDKAKIKAEERKRVVEAIKRERGAWCEAGELIPRDDRPTPCTNLAEDTHETAGKLASVGEAGASAALSGTALVAPPVSALLLVGFVAVSVVTLRAVDGRRVPCEQCGGEVRPGALVCPHCKAELT